jgi:DNA-binding XRE family transcriptional regulator
MKSKKTQKVKKPKEKLHSNRIKIILEEIGMSQQELADLSLSGNAAHLSRIMNGQRRCISLPIAIKICKILNKPVEEVFIYKEDYETQKDED